VILPRSGPHSPARGSSLRSRLGRALRLLGPAAGAATPARRRARWLRWAVAGVLAFTLLAGERGLVRLVGLERNRAALKAEIAKLESRRAELELRLAQLASDPATIERLAREELDLARPGETVYKFPGRE
jgi:cell division protein FtsB